MNRNELGQNQTERRTFRHERAVAKIETRAGDDMAHCVGYAAVFYRAGVAGTEFELFENTFERILPTAFDDIASNDVRGLFNHEPTLILGRNVSGTLRLDVDDVGLRYDITLPDTQVARDLAESINRGDVSGSSFAFFVLDARWIEETRDGVTFTIREVSRVNTLDVGPVTFPAYSATSTDVASRSLRDFRSERLAEEAVFKAAELARRVRLARARCG